ncbi:E3 ubiquitin-protein ligase TRIM71-like isoform X2 [Oopsacas minuta]|uniref:E3 ubiquitin-protein ligase TRIM71-like isoform X2 n=1 Tax=Oopsacas minuta TaxID=111878 RepID=A0AAV7JTS7_9METZ|nr:E3 ubiquitin-protein ligase TRIM71-like isoform X2 [Oopsacas minuta]
MASFLRDNTAGSNENVFMKIRKRIEEKFDSIIQKVVERREALIVQLELLEREYETQVLKMEEIESSKQEMEQLFTTLKLETAKKSLRKSITELNEEIEKSSKVEYPELSFVCETNDLEWRISELGKLGEAKNKEFVVRKYDNISKSLKTFGKNGNNSGKGKFNEPRGVLVDDKNNRIFIADMYNNRIQVWSINGDYISKFGKGTLKYPWEIVLCDNALYISDVAKHFVAKWCSSTFSFMTQTKTTNGWNEGQLDGPAGLDIDSGEVFVVERENNRISVFDLNLCFKRIMANKMINKSCCLRIRSNTIYIVEMTGIIKLFSKADQLMRTIGKNRCFSNNIFHFNFDSANNFLITDVDKNSLFILSPEGELIHSICFKDWKLNSPFGIDVSREGKLVVTFRDGSAAVGIF